MRDQYMDRQVTPRVTSLSWGPPPPCKQVLNLLVLIFINLIKIYSFPLPFLKFKFKFKLVHSKSKTFA